MKAAHCYLEENEHKIQSQVPLIVVHNDFNPRNVAITNEHRVKIYDWELATTDLPHRDFMEFYSFTKNPSLDLKELKSQFKKQFSGLFQDVPETSWEEGYKYGFSKFLVTRVGLYLLGNKLNNYEFIKPLMANMLKINEEEKYFV